MTYRIAMVAGEASGDLLAAPLIAALRRANPGALFFGIGGPKMQKEGFDPWWPAEALAVRGYVEVLRQYRQISDIRRQLLRRLRDDPPDVFIGIDAPDFNLWLEQRLKSDGIPAIHYVGPSIWAWRGGRIRKIARSVDQILTLFPFEPAIYRRHEIPVTYVGHPLADEIPLDIDRRAAREQLELAPDSPVVAMLPGSRQSEVRYMGDLCLATARKLHQRFPNLNVLIPLASRETRQLFEEAMWRCQAQDLPIKLMFGHAQQALAACDTALVASGTATLEAALVGAPMVIMYRMSPWTWRLMKRMAYQPWVGLPNILSGRFVVPEFLQDEATADNLAQALANQLEDGNYRFAVRGVFSHLHRQLRRDSAETAAAAVMPFLRNRRTT